MEFWPAFWQNRPLSDTTTRQMDGSEPRAPVALLQEGAASDVDIDISDLAARRSKLVRLYLCFRWRIRDHGLAIFWTHYPESFC